MPPLSRTHLFRNARRQGDETEYFEWMKRAFPGLFSSFHSFKSARAFVAKMKQVPGRWEKFCASMDKVLHLHGPEP